MGQSREAEDAYRRSLSVRAKLVAHHPGEPKFAKSLAQLCEILGRFLSQAGRHGEATDAFLRARNGYEKLVAEFPAEDSYKFVLAYLLGECPDPKVVDRKPRSGLRREAVNLQPRKNEDWWLLGLISYRAGDWNGAVVALEQARQLGPHDEPSTWFFWPWRSGGAASPTKLAPGSTEPTNGSRRIRSRIPNCRQSAPRRRPSWA